MTESTLKRKRSPSPKAQKTETSQPTAQQDRPSPSDIKKLQPEISPNAIRVAYVDAAGDEFVLKKLLDSIDYCLTGHALLDLLVAAILLRAKFLVGDGVELSYVLVPVLGLTANNFQIREAMGHGPWLAQRTRAFTVFAARGLSLWPCVQEGLDLGRRTCRSGCETLRLPPVHLPWLGPAGRKSPTL